MDQAEQSRYSRAQEVPAANAQAMIEEGLALDDMLTVSLHTEGRVGVWATGKTSKEMIEDCCPRQVFVDSFQRRAQPAQSYQVDVNTHSRLISGALATTTCIINRHASTCIWSRSTTVISGRSSGVRQWWHRPLHRDLGPTSTGLPKRRRGGRRAVRRSWKRKEMQKNYWHR